MKITEQMIETAARAIADANNVSRKITADQRRTGYERTDMHILPSEWDRLAAEAALRAALATDYKTPD